MKDLFIKTIIISLVAILESSFGLPVLTFTLFLIWIKKERNLFLVWIVLVSLLVSILWGILWWLSFFFLLCLRITFDYAGKFISNKFLKVILIISPIVLSFSLIIGINFHWRVVFYGLFSFIVIFILQRFLLVSHENKYL